MSLHLTVKKTELRKKILILNHAETFFTSYALKAVIKNFVKAKDRHSVRVAHSSYHITILHKTRQLRRNYHYGGIQEHKYYALEQKFLENFETSVYAFKKFSHFIVGI